MGKHNPLGPFTRIAVCDELGLRKHAIPYSRYVREGNKNPKAVCCPFGSTVAPAAYIVYVSCRRKVSQIQRSDEVSKEMSSRRYLLQPIEFGAREAVDKPFGRASNGAGLEHCWFKLLP